MLCSPLERDNHGLKSSGRRDTKEERAKTAIREAITASRHRVYRGGLEKEKGPGVCICVRARGCLGVSASAVNLGLDFILESVLISMHLHFFF